MSEEMEHSKEKARDYYLRNFQRENRDLDLFGRPKLDEIGIKILDLLKKKT